MSANLIGLGCDLQQKLDAMDRKLRRARWAGYVAGELYDIARRLHALDRTGRTGHGADAQDLLEQARSAVEELGFGIEVYRQPDPRGWPLVVVFPGDVPTGSGPEAVYEQGIAVPPKP